MCLESLHCKVLVQIVLNAMGLFLFVCLLFVLWGVVFIIILFILLFIYFFFFGGGGGGHDFHLHSYWSQ